VKEFAWVKALTLWNWLQQHRKKNKKNIFTGDARKTHKMLFNCYWQLAWLVGKWELNARD